MFQRRMPDLRAVPTGGSAAESLAARQNRVVTQTITRPYTTMTAVVTLGPGQTTTSIAPQATVTPSGATAPAAPTSSAIAIPGAVPSSSSGLTRTQLGAILGSVLGSIALIILLWYCVTQRRREEQARRVRYVVDDESETTSETVEVRPSRPRHPMPSWIPGVRVPDPWVRAAPGFGVVPPPPRFPPTPRYTPYRQTRNPQIRGVRRFP
jgi:hypothetical protein